MKPKSKLSKAARLKRLLASSPELRKVYLELKALRRASIPKGRRNPLPFVRNTKRRRRRRNRARLSRISRRF
ncbi:MAG: hypothetical protein AB1429_11325 [Pseudomonadota bacterium]|jgi:hypothetical protein